MIHELSKREIEVARLLGDNLTQEEIARELKISPRSVKQHTNQLRLKLGVSRSRHIPAVLRELGLL